MKFEDRVRQNAKLPRQRNQDLPAGSPVFYYCRLCGAEMVVPESHIEPAPRFCLDCVSEGRAKDQWTTL